MRLDRLTTKSREAIQEAQSIASRRGNPDILPEHVLRALLDQEGGVVRPMIEKAGADVAALERSIDAHLQSLPRVSGGSEPGLGRRTQQMFTKAEDEA